MRSIARLAWLFSALALLAGACAGDQGPGDAGSAARTEDASSVASDAAPSPAARPPGEGLEAVATVFPLAWLATEIAPHARVTLLGSNGQDPHDLELSPSERALLESADIVLYLGEIGFQPQVEGVVPTTAGEVVEVATVAGHDRLLPVEHDSHQDAHDDHAHDSPDHDGHDSHNDDGHDHDHGAWDPHVWFDAAVMSEVAERIGAAFAAADPAYAATYEDRAQALRDELLALDGEIDALLTDCAHEVAIVSHEAYGYLLAPRGLGQEGVSGAGGHGEASPSRLAELVQRIHAEDIPAVLAEPVEGRADAEALAREAGVPLLEIDPLEIVDDASERGYPQLLREQAWSFAEALDCD